MRSESESDKRIGGMSKFRTLCRVAELKMMLALPPWLFFAGRDSPLETLSKPQRDPQEMERAVSPSVPETRRGP